MEMVHNIKQPKSNRDCSTKEEQLLCLEAMESGAYDDMSDQEWVALCERLAAGVRHPLDDDGMASPEAPSEADSILPLLVKRK